MMDGTRGGRALAAWLKDKEKTQEWLAGQIGTRQSSVQAWLAGREPKLGAARAIQAITGIPMDWFVVDGPKRARVRHKRDGRRSFPPSAA